MHKHFIDGRYVDTAGQARIDVFNPATGKMISSIADGDDSTVNAAVRAARKAQPEWAARVPQERAGYLRALAAGVRSRADDLARTIVQEQGKLLDLARVEVGFTADYLDYMAEWARRIEGEIIPSDRKGEHILLMRKPLGVVAGILPWNFPFFLIARKLAPALLTGNTVVIKPSEETPNNAALFAEIVAQSDLPAGVFNLVYGRGKSVGAALAAHAGIDMVSFTGSVETGSAIMAAAAPNITKLNLELGGKAPAIVMDDADIDLAVRAIVGSRIINSGQVCNCAERVYVHRSVAQAFSERFVQAMKAVRYGDPLGATAVDMGPMIHAQAALRVQAVVERAVAGGAVLLAGGKAREIDGGMYFEPTVLANCAQDSEVMQREVFGPVAPLHIVDSLDEAIAKANDSVYGLTSSIYTRSLDNALYACDKLEFGETYVNRENFEAMQGYHAGAKRSGIGGADGKHGIYEYTRTQLAYIQTHR